MESIRLRLTADPNAPVLGCPRCDTALLPEGEWPRGGPASARCPLCGWEQHVAVVEVGEGFPYNADQQREDLAASPIYTVESIRYDEDLCLIAVTDLLEDPAFYALQDGVAPVRSFGWVAGEGLMGEQGHRLFLVVRVSDLPEQDLFRIEFPAERRVELGRLTEDTTVVLVSERKGVLFAEAGEIYLEAVREAEAQPGSPTPLNVWVTLEDQG